MTCASFIAYTYANPLESTGDGIRIRAILEGLSATINTTIAVLYLADINSSVKDSRVMYLARRRRVYSFLPSNVGNSYFGMELVKLFQLIFDEPFIILSTLCLAKRTRTFVVHGSMSMAPILLRLVNKKTTIIFDPLANYAQTLYTRMRVENLFRSLLTRFRLGAFLLLHKMSLRCSDIILYPSKYDEINAQKMFRLRDKLTLIVPNPFPIAYKDLKEFYRLRKLYREKIRVDQKTRVLILTAGSRVAVNEEALKMVLGIPYDKDCKLIITGPWEDFNRIIVKRADILIAGRVSQSELKGLLAAADVGLCPVFYGSGTFLKILGYLAAGVKILTTPLVVATMPKDLVVALKGRLYVATNEREFLKMTLEVAKSTDPLRDVRSIVTKNSANDSLNFCLRQLASELESRTVKQ